MINSSVSRFVKYYSRSHTLPLYITYIFTLGHCLAFSQCLINKTAGTNPADVAALDAAYNIPSPHVFGEMIGINDAGQFQSIQNELNPISFLTTKMRAFHAMDYDFNENPQFGVTQYTDLTKPKDVNGIPEYMDLGRL